ncbi:MAG: catalase family peroxidase [Rhodospirillales bacterium]
MSFPPARQTLLAALSVAALAIGPARAQEAPEQIVNAMNKLWGSHAGFRANHAKGVVVEGSFTGAKQAASLSKAPLFTGAAIPITVRFSDATGIPTLPDGEANANPHGMAIKFHMPDASEFDMVTNSLKTFPVATAEDFRDLLIAISVSGPGSAKPTKLEQFVAAHPSVPRASGTLATPSSFARETYNGVNAFVFVNAAGTRQPFRFRIDPVAGTDHLTPADAARQAPDFLMSELPARLGREPVVFRLMAQLANPGDPTKDATIAWPADRKLVEIGTITLTKAVADSADAQKKLLFLPTNLPTGIEPSDDPLIDARTQAYAISFTRRSQ